jgi:hypothetical protein
MSFCSLKTLNPLVPEILQIEFRQSPGPLKAYLIPKILSLLFE